MTIVSIDTPESRETIGLNGSIAPDAVFGLVNLAVFLRSRSYPLGMRAKVLDYVAREGTLEGCDQIHQKHAATAESAFIDGMAAVPIDDPAWGSRAGAEFFGNLLDDVWNPTEAPALDVAELLHTDAEFDAWLASVDAAFPPMFDAIA